MRTPNFSSRPTAILKSNPCHFERKCKMKNAKAKINNAISVLFLLSTFTTFYVAQLSTAFAQGSLTPPGAPAPTMITLSQIEPRTPISSAPFTITNPGSYYLTTNVTVSSGNGIIIAASDVTLDLGGFTIFSTDPANTGQGISFGVHTNITI